MIEFKNTPKYFTNIIQRFYNSANQQLVGKQPEQQLFTRFLQKVKPQSVVPSTLKSKNQPNEFFKVGRGQYLSFADQHPLGSVIEMNHKGLDLTLLSTSFSTKDIPGLYKSIQKIKPEVILVQVRPDLLLADFNLIPKRNNIFSDKLYLKQLVRSPFEVMPSHDIRDYVSRKLRGRVTMKEMPENYQAQYNSKVEKSKLFGNFVSKQLINNYVIGTSAFYCQRNNLEMILCGLPQISQRQIIANQFSLMELQVMFKRACEQLALYSRVTPRKTANFLFPEIFLNPSDHYLFMLIQYMAALKKYKNVLVLTGVMENHAVKQYLQNRSLGTILESILPPKPEGSILREIDNFQVVEKHCILDVMEFGAQILETPIDQLETTNKLSKFYADPHFVSKQIASNIMKFRFDMYQKYLKVMEQSKKVGETIKTKDWIRRAIES